jgi:hypothetical protein
VERRRRDYMNECIQELGAILPQDLFEGELRPNKTQILKKAVEHIRLLTEEVKELSEKLKETPYFAHGP